LPRGEGCSKQIAKGTIVSSDLKDHKAGPAGATGKDGAAGAPGAPGAAGLVRAVALVNGTTGDVIESTAVGITDANVYHGTLTGQLCIKGLPFTPKNVQAVPDASDVSASQNATVSTSVGDQGGGCNSGAQAGVYTVANGAQTPFAVYIAIS
jgi:hypothetical protein